MAGHLAFGLSIIDIVARLGVQDSFLKIREPSGYPPKRYCRPAVSKTTNPVMQSRIESLNMVNNRASLPE
jgi:hypothetical protein